MIKSLLYRMPYSHSFPEEELEGLRAAQALSYRCARDIAKELQEGWTEVQTARLMDTYLRDSGVKAHFHKSFAWFGDRTRFDGMTNWFQFLPSDRRLRAGDAIILDTSPIFNGYAADIGYSTSLGPNAKLDQALKTLASLRESILALFTKRKLSGAEICEAVVLHIRQAGYEPVHHRYPGAVLGHRLHRMTEAWRPPLPIPFSWQAVTKILSRGVVPDLLNEEHQGNLLGGWAIEPHLGGDGFGCKFEEMIVVDEKGARWLAPETPWI